MSLAQEVKERTDIVEVVSGYVSLKKSGRNFKALCPFHTEKTPSFVVFPDRQSWYCFGACATGGDVFSFLMKIENISFSEALRMLARRAGISLAPKTSRQLEEDRERDRILGMNQAAARYFHDSLVGSPEAEAARAHLRSRSIAEPSWQAFQLGYAAGEWESLTRHLGSLGYQEDEIIFGGLAIKGERGVHDRFRGRIIFAIRDSEGQTVGFGARSLDGSDPKYLNSPETLIFSKGSVVYGIDLAKGSIREKDQVILVEGYTDVILAHQKGFPNVVASMGTSLTENQVQILKRLTRNLVLALDADVAGEAATERGLEIMQDVFRDQTVPVPWGRNLIEHQRRLDAEIKIALLPPGKDPADLLASLPEEWASLVASALPIMDYYFSLAASRFDLQSAKGKADAARLLIPLFRELPSEVQQEHYFQKLARTLKVDERRLRQEVVPPRYPLPREALGKRGTLSARPGFTFGVERHILLLLMEKPSRRNLIDQALGALGTGHLERADFSGIEEGEIFSSLQESSSLPEEWDPQDFLENADPIFKENLSQLFELQKGLSFLRDEEGKGVLGGILLSAEPDEESILVYDEEWGAVQDGFRLRAARLLREIESLRFLLEDGDPETGEHLLTELGRRTLVLGRIWKGLAVWADVARGREENFWSAPGSGV